jgi:hypothetical protein
MAKNGEAGERTKMKIQKKHVYHGVALTQILEHPSCESLKKAEDNEYGHYRVNRDIHILVKYATAWPWEFTFSEDHLRTIKDARQVNSSRTFICLVCGDKTVWLLDEEEIDDLLDLSRLSQQWIRVDTPEDCSSHVSGTKGVLRHMVSHNSFPDRILGPRRKSEWVQL